MDCENVSVGGIAGELRSGIDLKVTNLGGGGALPSCPCRKYDSSHMAWFGKWSRSTSELRAWYLSNKAVPIGNGLVFREQSRTGEVDNGIGKAAMNE
jgi:hypothetical protein